MRPLARCLALLLVGISCASVAAATELGLITGAENGTYHQFGHDLRRLVKPSGINVTVHPSNGAVDNVFAVSQRRGIQLGIVQSDVLAFVADQAASAAVSRVARNVRMVFPLYDEEVHVLGRREITDFDQLAGKRVAIGREGSGTYLTARLLFKRADIVPGELVPLDAGEALGHLKAGRLDALVYVAGTPVGLLRHQVKAADGLALIPITSPRIRDAYAGVEIPADVYDWQVTPVRTVAVKAVLISYDLPDAECESIGRFAQQVAGGMDWLVKNGHPKWKQVDLDYALKGWEQYDCVRKHLAKTPPDGGSPAASAGERPPTERNPIADAIRDVLGAP
jgi:uncharacterized protein